MDIERVIANLPIYAAGGKPSQDTLRAYKRTGMYFINWLSQHGRNPDAPTEQDAAEYVAELYAANMKRDGVNQRIAGGRAFYRVASKIGEYTGENPFEKIHGRISNPEDATTEFFTPDELKEIYTKCETERERAIFLLMAIEGLRTIEVVRMQIKDYDRKNQRLRVHGKGDHDAWIYPSELTQDTLSNYIGTRVFGNVFVNDIDGSPLTREGVKYIVNRMLRRAGLKKRGASCHALRHSCGTNLYAVTKDLRLVQETLRHHSPQVTARYTHITNRRNVTNALTEGLI